ncbi:uncharacterized protein [Arachis hypogaea]|uniref:uncharacterized protein isoform X2 n=1 Tax=Arachis hypogaea TaxID=3818 RepID=UPI003B20E593
MVREKGEEREAVPMGITVTVVAAMPSRGRPERESDGELSPAADPPPNSPPSRRHVTTQPPWRRCLLPPNRLSRSTARRHGGRPKPRERAARGEVGVAVPRSLCHRRAQMRKERLSLNHDEVGRTSAAAVSSSWTPSPPFVPLIRAVVTSVAVRLSAAITAVAGDHQWNPHRLGCR